MKTIWILLLTGIVAFLIVGCASGDTADTSKVNNDVGTGEMPAKLQGSEGAGGGGVPAPETDKPSTSPD